ncbi:CASP-like protein [Rhynchospora pubera]|uniref:CASP-like protein n=1 Tax=Rhynchospora pubera TaxID=906938 RepID=A0AAV8E189_9POAL|nr:CASP-like protein [Rhynchospora pubera]
MAAVTDNPNPMPETLPESSAPRDLEKGSGAAPTGSDTTGEGSGGEAAVAAVVRRWKREDLLDRATLLLRAAAWLFSVISFLVMAANKHGDWKEFENYEEYRYIVGIGVLSFLYSMAQVIRHVHRLSGGTDPIPTRFGAILDFAGDQVTAYLLMSALSAAIPITNRMREGVDNVFTDSSAASISMAFFAFIALALSSLISGFKLCKQPYI